MKRLAFIFAFLIVCSAIQANARGIMTMCGAGVPSVVSCTTPTGDELTESFGDASTSCWSGGDNLCNNTWTVTAGSPTIADVPSGAPANTACTKGLYFDGSSAAVNVMYDFGAGTIPNNVAVTINFTMYIESSEIPQYNVRNIVILNDNASSMLSSTLYGAVAIARSTTETGSATKIRAIGNAGTSTCEINFSEDTWYDITLTLDAAGDANGSTLSDGTNSCNFTRDTDASRYLYVGVSASNVVGYVGNIRVTTP